MTLCHTVTLYFILFECFTEIISQNQPSYDAPGGTHGARPKLNRIIRKIFNNLWGRKRNPMPIENPFSARLNDDDLAQFDLWRPVNGPWEPYGKGDGWSQNQGNNISRNREGTSNRNVNSIGTNDYYPNENRSSQSISNYGIHNQMDGQTHRSSENGLGNSYENGQDLSKNLGTQDANGGVGDKRVRANDQSVNDRLFDATNNNQQPRSKEWKNSEEQGKAVASENENGPKRKGQQLKIDKDLTHKEDNQDTSMVNSNIISVDQTDDNTHVSVEKMLENGDGIQPTFKALDYIDSNSYVSVPKDGGGGNPLAEANDEPRKTENNSSSLDRFGSGSKSSKGWGFGWNSGFSTSGGIGWSRKSRRKISHTTKTSVSEEHHIIDNTHKITHRGIANS
ncbi:hypothetical protein Ddc_04337 [Ditylenchus destructor]|nr:hypothetical protein Ddc_04337 [Ditylenchus destructor]